MMANTVRAPELETNLGWLNTEKPLHFAKDLRGQIVLLDFWTYCCINCIHILPDLKYLEHKYKNDPVCFIGVHSAKFTNESSAETIRAAILRYEIEHPVVIDENMRLWREFAVRSWPTQVVVDSRGYVAAVAAGEGNRQIIDEAIEQALEQGKAAKALADAPLSLKKEAIVSASSGLRFPGKVHADAASKRLYIADSNHNRIVIADWPDQDGACRLVKVVGTGAIGAADGPAEQATFDHPQGLTIGQGKLYVADTENHLIRTVDLDTYEVTTAVGTGEMSNDRAGGLMGTQQGLNSPWDLAIEGSTLYVAMAGTHQVWRIDMPVGFARAFAGSGRENLVDGPTETAALAQTSGICSLGGHLYIADSEVSAIRGIDMNAEQVFTVIGEGLFSFGDVDGPHPKAKLQHPLGIDGWGTSLIIADTYNHKIKLVDPRAASVRTLYGDGQSGLISDDESIRFFEPGGLSVAENDLFVADTNNHRVVHVDLKTNEWKEIVVEGLTAPASSNATNGANDSPIDAQAVSLAENKELELLLDITLPDKAHINSESPWSVLVSSEGTVLMQVTGRSDSLPLKVAIPAGTVTAPTTWQVSAQYAYCNNDDGTCVPATVSWNLPVSPGGDAAASSLTLEM